MKLGRLTPLNSFSIWSRRYHDNKVLLAAHRIGTHNKVVFTKDKGMGASPYYISGTDAKKCHKESNGSITCYSVPIEKLEPLEIDNKDLREVM